MIHLSEQVTEHGIYVVHLRIEEQNMWDFSNSPEIKHTVGIRDFRITAVASGSDFRVISVQLKFSFNQQQFMSSLKCWGKLYRKSCMNPPPHIFVVWNYKHSWTHAGTYTQFGYVCHSRKNRLTICTEFLVTQPIKKQKCNLYFQIKSQAMRCIKWFPCCSGSKVTWAVFITVQQTNDPNLPTVEWAD